MCFKIQLRKLVGHRNSNLFRSPVIFVVCENEMPPWLIHRFWYHKQNIIHNRLEIRFYLRGCWIWKTLGRNLEGCFAKAVYVQSLPFSPYGPHPLYCHPPSLVFFIVQVESLHSMYHKLLVLVDKDSQDVKRKTKWNLPKMAAVQGEFFDGLPRWQLQMLYRMRIFFLFDDFNCQNYS